MLSGMMRCNFVEILPEWGQRSGLHPLNEENLLKWERTDYGMIFKHYKERKTMENKKAFSHALPFLHFYTI